MITFYLSMNYFIFLRYTWLTSSWSKCKLPKGLSQELCGGGLQFRNVTCVSKETGWEISSDECHLNPLSTVQRYFETFKLISYKGGVGNIHLNRIQNT